MSKMGTDRGTTLFVGDQLFTDMLAANRIGAVGVLVAPICKREWWATKVFNRTRERAVWKKVFPGQKRRSFSKGD